MHILKLILRKFQRAWVHQPGLPVAPAPTQTYRSRLSRSASVPSIPPFIRASRMSACPLVSRRAASRRSTDSKLECLGLKSQLCHSQATLPGMGHPFQDFSLPISALGHCENKQMLAYVLIEWHSGQTLASDRVATRRVCSLGRVTGPL